MIAAARAWVLGVLDGLGQFGLFAQETFASALTRRPFGQEWLRQIYFIGVKSQSVVLITGAFTGMVLAAQTFFQFHKVHMDTATLAVVSVSMCSELGPVLTGLMVAGRVGAALAAELGTMRVTEQIDAITMLRTDPVEYLVVPRLLAMLIMTPVQCLLFFAVAVWSGQLSSTALYSIPPQVFWNSVRTWLDPSDLPSMLTKAVVFGLQIAVIACGWGLTTRGGPKEVGTSTTGAVVMILVTVSLMDVVLTQLLFGD